LIELGSILLTPGQSLKLIVAATAGISCLLHQSDEEELQLWLQKVDRFFTSHRPGEGIEAYYPTRDADYPAQIKAHRSVLVRCL